MSAHITSTLIGRVPHDRMQLHEAESLGFMPKDHTRPTVTTHAIDNVTPDIQADRDDGVFVELNDKEGGGYKVTVTIADVAAHVPLNSTLARVANERAFTRYRPENLGGNDPMFPKALEERMSLEHGKERLGLSVTMELDERFQLTHTSFEPTLAVPDNVDYAMAGERAKTDEQFKHLHEVAQGIFQGTFGGNFQLLRDAAPMLRESEADDQSIESSLMVASYMLLANHAVASFFEKTQLPFVYRNFDGTHQGANGMDRAFYDTQFTAHTELEKTGLSGAYCHFTSPIRRAPDYYNGHMVHYAYAVKEKIQERVWATTSLKIDTEAEHLLWDQMPDILKALNEAQKSPKNEGKQDALKEALRKASVLLMREDFSIEEPPFKGTADVLYTEVMGLKPPFKNTNLKDSVREINTLCDQERDVLGSPEMRAAYRQEERVSMVHSYAPARLRSMSSNEFSAAIRNCALTRELPEKVEAEALKRFKSEGVHFNKALDAMYVLVVARDAEGEGWRRLRKAMIRAVRDDSITVGNVLFMASLKGYFNEEEIPVLEELRIPIKHETQYRDDPSEIRAAILHTADNRAAPFYSIGHDSRAALTHARYSFLEHLAFDDLHPLGEAAVPNLLYAGLEEKQADKEHLLRELVGEHGGEVVMEYRSPRSGQSEHLVSLRVRGGEFGEGIDATAYADSKEQATQSAMRKILRKPVFKDTVKTFTSEETYRFLHPETALKEAMKERGWRMRVHTEGAPKGSGHRFTALVSLFTDLRPPEIETESGLLQYSGEGMNQSRAINAACVKALTKTPTLSMPQLSEQAGRSWVGDAAGKEAAAPARVMGGTASTPLAVIVEGGASHEWLTGKSQNITF